MLKGLLQIRDQICGVFKANVQAHHGFGSLPSAVLAQTLGLGCQGQAFIATP